MFPASRLAKPDSPEIAARPIVVKTIWHGALLLLFPSAHASPALPANRCSRAGATGANNGTDWTNAFTGFPTFVRGDIYYVADRT